MVSQIDLDLIRYMVALWQTVIESKQAFSKSYHSLVKHL